MSQSTLIQLKDAWRMDKEQINKGIFESVLDSNVLKSNLKLSYFFQTHLLPQPFWGNIINPRIVVLGLNPSYDPVNDEQDELILKNGLDRNLNDYNFKFNWFDYKKTINNDVTSGFKFWSQTLGELHHGNDNLYCDEKRIFDKVGFFNLYGYHKSPFKEIQQKCFKETCNDKYLPTQIALFNHLKSIISKDTHVIVIWGHQYWEDTGLLSEHNIDTSKLLIVNRNQGNNNIITNAHKSKYQEKSYKDFSSNMINLGGTIINSKDVYDKYYQEIAAIINEI